MKYSHGVNYFQTLMPQSLNALLASIQKTKITQNHLHFIYKHIIRGYRNVQIFIFTITPIKL